MQIKYISQPHQTNAINATIDIFTSQEHVRNEYDIFDGEAVCSNVLTLDVETILQNLQNVQKSNNIEISTELDGLEFSIEMETGTGKTYVYIKTILEMYEKYGWSKFIIITPSIAIREGVLNSLNSMQIHFQEDYNFPYDFFEYDSSRLSSLKHFIRDDTLNIMVMTIDSFKRAGTVLNMPREGFVGTPKESLQKTNPILILDEPQNMESELSKTSISELNPLFTLRYSATHKNYYNLLYSLSPKEAFEKGLVKQIDVLALSENQTINDVYINVLKIEIDKKSRRPVATLELIANNKDEFVKKKVKIKHNDSLKAKSKNPIYAGFIVDEINFKELYIQFENGLKLHLHEVNGQVKRQIQERQISEAIQLHMQKFEILKEKGIKVLSLFFIDKVANFLKEEDGWIESYFCAEFDKYKKKFESFKDVNVHDIYASYFAKRKSGFVDELKSNDSDRKLAKKTYDLIMKEKEKLLSFEENVSFIFSHSALKEGWDNPNVFFITTLNDTKSEMKKRQILGRGVRLAVDKTGKRVEDKNINRLTVIANESFDEFARTLQLEYEAVGAGEFTPPNNVKKRKKAVLRTELLELREFKALWKKLKQKTLYEINLDSSQYKKDVVSKLKNIEVREKKILKQFGSLNSSYDGSIEDEKSFKLEYEEELPNIVAILEKNIGISRKTIIEIFETLGFTQFVQEFSKNSDAYVKEALECFKDVMYEMLSKDGLIYKKIDDYYELSNIFVDVIDGYDLQESQKGLYTFEQYDSDVEKDFISCADKHFKFFTKLPKSFKIKTPLGTYNPDFAIIKHDESEGAFVIETKGSQKEKDLRARERWQIAYAKKHFELIDVAYKKRKNCKDI